MRRARYHSIIAILICAPAFGQTPDVGSGAPTAAIQGSFVNAYYRNGFSNLVSLPPLANVKALGSQGLVQEFADASKNQTNKYALIKPSISAPVVEGTPDVLQMYPALYAYYVSITPNNAGYPASDTLSCPGLVSIQANSCQYQLLDKPYALFAYQAPIGTATTFSVRNPFYTKWQSLGGVSSVGPPIAAEQAVTSPFATTATVQIYDQGALVNVTSGTLNGRILAIGQVIYSLYASNGGATGFLGLPTAEESTLASGVHRQTFEGGVIEYVPGSDPTLRYPVQNVSVLGGLSSIKLNLGDTRVVQAVLLDPNGNPITDRAVTWSTSNLRVISIQSSGLSATLTAVGGGSALVTASSEGKSSAPLTVVVSAPCCGIGEGAPTPALQQVFVDAVNRNRIKVQLPASTPVTRAGSGYIQYLQDTSATNYLVTVSDRAVSGFVVTGPLLDQYRALGGPSGALGYPIADMTTGGRQLFQNQSALAGNPPQLVSGAFFVRWAALGYETGAAGSPASSVTQALSFRATLGQIQIFSNGALLSALTGAQSGKVYFVSGLVQVLYDQTGGAFGALGLPISDEGNSSGKRRQDFEGGYIDYAQGDTVAQLHLSARVPVVTATPSSVVAGGRVRIAVGGFNSGSTLRVSLTGQPDFTVRTDNGAFAWELVVSASARSSVVSVHAADTGSSGTADGSYTVRATSDAVLQIAKTSGDGQTAIPGAVLPQPLVVTVRDDAGNPVSGTAVTFNASPGGQIVSAASTTGANGQAQALLRLPPSDGLALATAQAGRQFVTFTAQALHSSLAGFPTVSQASASGPLGNGPATIAEQGALLASATAIIRYLQNRAELPGPNGLAELSLLNQFLKSSCVLDSDGAQICDGFVSPFGADDQIVNLWRLGAFVGGGLTVSVDAPDPAAVRDSVAQGFPVLLALSLTSGGAPAGAHYVVATGVASDGGILIMDPNPALARTNLNDYLSGFGAIRATLVGVVRLIARAPALPGFLVAGDPVFGIISPSGACGANLDLLSATRSTFRMRYCDGAADQYQLDFTGDGHLTFTDLASPGFRSDLTPTGSGAFSVTRAGVHWDVAPQQLSFSAQGVVNSASFTPDLAPGGLFAVFGSGLTRGNARTVVEVAGIPAAVVGQSPFQINAQIPTGLAAGTFPLKITSGYGTAQQTIVVKDVAPAIFQVSSQIAAILNQNSTLNTPDNPAGRGSVIVVFCTGLGAVASQGGFQVTRTAVTGILGGTALRPDFAGLTPGFVGLYQVNLQIPAATAPGLNLSLTIRQGNSTSNTVQVAIQ